MDGWVLFVIFVPKILIFKIIFPTGPAVNSKIATLICFVKNAMCCITLKKLLTDRGND